MFFLFYTAGLAFTLSVCVVVILTLITLILPSARNQLQYLILPTIWIFLSAATLEAIAYIWEWCVALTSYNPYESFTFQHSRIGGYYAWVYWLTLTFVILPQLLWFTRVRRQPVFVLLIGIFSLSKLILAQFI
jgi:molybdopterin-containing oxidoreductase family membrane subunit